MDSVADHPDGWGFPIRISPDQSMLATPRSFSQPTTSFIASQCQGIRQTPLLCLISQLLFVSEDRSHDRSSARSVQGTTPTTKTALCSTYPFLPLRLVFCVTDTENIATERGILDFRPHYPMNNV